MKPKNPFPQKAAHPLAGGATHALQPGVDPVVVAASVPLLQESMATMQGQVDGVEPAINVQTPSHDLLSDSMSTMQTQPID